jgi:hypothetical protein
VTISEKEANQIHQYHQQINEIRKVEENFKKNHIRPFFPRKLHFGEVFNEN